MSNLNPGGLTRVLNYVKTWVTGLLNDKANSSHSHTKSQITDFPTIPTKTSQLTNDSGFLSAATSIKVTRGKSISTSGSGYWAAMCNSTAEGSPTLPTTGAWWHVLSMDWSGNDTDVINWCSQLALPTQDGSCLYWRKNDAGGTSINSSTWHKVIDDTNIGSQSVNYANSAGNAANVTGTVAIGHGGTGATTRLGAVQNLTNENVGTSTEYFLTITTNWGKAGYCSVADAKSVLGVPTNTNQLTNGAGFITSSGSCNYANSAGKADYLGDIGSTDRNSASGTGWYSVGFSYSYDEGHGELAINNYWGIRLNCRDSAHVSINGSRINVENATYLNGYRVYVG